jgi:hypothetical protein
MKRSSALVFVAPAWRRLALLPALAVLLLSGCATTPSPGRDDSAFQKARPGSVLVLPPINDTPDVLATPSVLAQLTYPLAESGFYVLPVSLVDETLRVNGIQTQADAHQIAPAKLREIFGADAVLYVAVKRYGAVYQVLASDAVVTLQAKLVDLRSGQLLWQGQATASSNGQGGNGGGGLVALLVTALVEHIANNLTDRSHTVAGIASQRLLGAGRPGGLPYGPRSPLFAKDMPAPR